MRMKTLYCPRCYSKLRRATLAWEKHAGYAWLCNKCDENFFNFEAVTKKEIKRKRLRRAYD